MEVDGGGFPFGRCRKRVETPESSSMGIPGDLLLTFPLLADIMEARKEIGNDLGRGNWTLRGRFPELFGRKMLSGASSAEEMARGAEGEKGSHEGIDGRVEVLLLRFRIFVVQF